MIKYIAVVFIGICFVLGCSKDDICTGETPATPKLIIKFKSSINNNVPKQVTDLTVTTIIENDTIEIYKSVTTDSIAIPLNTAMEFTTFQFVKNNTTNNPGNPDNITFNYQRDYVYINRACSYKTFYQNLVSELEVVEDENWINEIIVKETSVEDENTTHVTIFH